MTHHHSKLVFKFASIQCIIGFVTIPQTFWTLLSLWLREYVYWYLASGKITKVSEVSHLPNNLWVTGQVRKANGIESSSLSY